MKPTRILLLPALAALALDIRRFEKARKDVQDPELKAFVEKTLPVLRDHLAAAQKLPQSGKNAAAMGANRR